MEPSIQKVQKVVIRYHHLFIAMFASGHKSEPSTDTWICMRPLYQMRWGLICIIVNMWRLQWSEATVLCKIDLYFNPAAFGSQNCSCFTSLKYFPFKLQVYQQYSFKTKSFFFLSLYHMPHWWTVENSENSENLE